jgi:hypothetical protein
MVVVRVLLYNHLLSWSFPGGAQCTILLSHFEIGMSSTFGFTTPIFTSAHITRQNPTSSEDATSMQLSHVLVKIGQMSRTWGLPFIESQTSHNTHQFLSLRQNHLALYSTYLLATSLNQPWNIGAGVRDEDLFILASHLCPSNWIVDQHIFEFAIVLVMWKTFWLHVVSNISKASRPWPFNLNGIPLRGMYYKDLGTRMLFCTLVKWSPCHGITKFTLSGWCES